MRRRRRAIAVFASNVALLSTLATGSASSALSGRSESEYVGYPISISVLGHSGATGLNSDPRRPGIPVPANSWATGANPAVNSLYLRILRENLSIRGRNFNLAQLGARVGYLVLQAQSAVALDPKPDLVGTTGNDEIAAWGGNDVVCGGDGNDELEGGPGNDLLFGDVSSTLDSPPLMRDLGDVGPTSGKEHA